METPSVGTHLLRLSRAPELIAAEAGASTGILGAVTLFDGSVDPTDGGMETTLIYHDGIELPDFAAFMVLASEHGRSALAAYPDAYLSVAEAHGLPIVLDTPTWRASSDWAARLGYSADDLAAANRDAVAFVRDVCADRKARILVSGAIGPRGQTATSPAT